MELLRRSLRSRNIYTEEDETDAAVAKMRSNYHIYPANKFIHRSEDNKRLPNID